MLVAYGVDFIETVHGNAGVEAQVDIGFFGAKHRCTNAERRGDHDVGQGVGQGVGGGDPVVLAVNHLNFGIAGLVLVFVTHALYA